MAHRARKAMLASIMAVLRPTPETSVLDVGVTSDTRPESNFFEQEYPFRNRIVAVGLENVAGLKRMYPDLRALVANGLKLPFADKSFDLVVCFAVVEHAGTRDSQRALVHELCRVGSVCVVTTPNRWFPIEVHTLTPLLHWLPPRAFRWILKAFGSNFYADEAHLNLLDEKSLRSLFPTSSIVTSRNHRLFGCTSNLVVISQTG